MRTAIRLSSSGPQPGVALLRDDDAGRSVELPVDDRRLNVRVERDDVRLVFLQVLAEGRLLRGGVLGKLPDRREIEERVADVAIAGTGDERLEPAVVGE